MPHQNSDNTLKYITLAGLVYLSIFFSDTRAWAIPTSSLQSSERRFAGSVNDYINYLRGPGHLDTPGADTTLPGGQTTPPTNGQWPTVRGKTVADLYAKVQGADPYFDKKNQILKSQVRIPDGVFTESEWNIMQNMTTNDTPYIVTGPNYGFTQMKAALMENALDHDPQRTMHEAETQGQTQATQAGDAAADTCRGQAASAIGFCSSYLENFTTQPQWNLVRNQIFVPMAILLLLPGAVLAQMRAIIAAGSPILGEVNPFEGILRSLVAIFLIPGTALVVNYGIDLNNSIAFTINSEYTRIFGSDMYKDALCAEMRATPVRQTQSNRNALDQQTYQGRPLLGATSAFGRFEGAMMENSIQDPCSGINQSPAQAANENMSSGMAATRLMMNGSNASLAAAWNVLCAFQLAYLYYLWCVGPIMAALWVYPLRTLRNALPSWVEGVVTLCFWSLFWNTVILLMACFKGVDETGTMIMTALNFLATASVKYAFDFAGLVKAAGQEAAGMAAGAAKQAAQGGGQGGARGGQRSNPGSTHTPPTPLPAPTPDHRIPDGTQIAATGFDANSGVLGSEGAVVPATGLGQIISASAPLGPTNPIDLEAVTQAPPIHQGSFDPRTALVSADPMAWTLVASDVAQDTPAEQAQGSSELTNQQGYVVGLDGELVLGSDGQPITGDNLIPGSDGAYLVMGSDNQPTGDYIVFNSDGQPTVFGADGLPIDIDYTSIIQNGPTLTDALLTTSSIDPSVTANPDPIPAVAGVTPSALDLTEMEQSVATLAGIGTPSVIPPGLPVAGILVAHGLPPSAGTAEAIAATPTADTIAATPVIGTVHTAFNLGDNNILLGSGQGIVLDNNPLNAPVPGTAILDGPDLQTTNFTPTPALTSLALGGANFISVDSSGLPGNNFTTAGSLELPGNDIITVDSLGLPGNYISAIGSLAVPSNGTDSNTVFGAPGSLPVDNNLLLSRDFTGPMLVPGDGTDPNTTSFVSTFQGQSINTGLPLNPGFTADGGTAFGIANSPANPNTISDPTLAVTNSGGAVNLVGSNLSFDQNHPALFTPDPLYTTSYGTIGPVPDPTLVIQNGDSPRTTDYPPAGQTNFSPSLDAPISLGGNNNSLVQIDQSVPAGFSPTQTVATSLEGGTVVPQNTTSFETTNSGYQDNSQLTYWAPSAGDVYTAYNAPIDTTIVGGGGTEFANVGGTSNVQQVDGAVYSYPTTNSSIDPTTVGGGGTEFATGYGVAGIAYANGDNVVANYGGNNVAQPDVSNSFVSTNSGTQVDNSGIYSYPVLNQPVSTEGGFFAADPNIPSVGTAYTAIHDNSGVANQLQSGQPYTIDNSGQSPGGYTTASSSVQGASSDFEPGYPGQGWFANTSNEHSATGAGGGWEAPKPISMLGAVALRATGYRLPSANHTSAVPETRVAATTGPRSVPTRGKAPAGYSQIQPPAPNGDEPPPVERMTDSLQTAVMLGNQRGVRARPSDEDADETKRQLDQMMTGLNGGTLV